MEPAHARRSVRGPGPDGGVIGQPIGAGIGIAGHQKTGRDGVQRVRGRRADGVGQQTQDGNGVACDTALGNGYSISAAPTEECRLHLAPYRTSSARLEPQSPDPRPSTPRLWLHAPARAFHFRTGDAPRARALARATAQYFRATHPCAARSLTKVRAYGAVFPGDAPAARATAHAVLSIFMCATHLPRCTPRAVRTTARSSTTAHARHSAVFPGVVQHTKLLVMLMAIDNHLINIILAQPLDELIHWPCFLNWVNNTSGGQVDLASGWVHSGQKLVARPKATQLQLTHIAAQHAASRLTPAVEALAVYHTHNATALS
ncbi:hypothetical protein GGX14DRAFT_403205 [Mycena pura]|uniref:Uncharacterized protein n=1 Tax=Mycena pura TaxID=153505 RepID=A0AAD6Y1B6_9AGAR|nr:hypothetical protein GGX14DRAFT_403205 [Mycena pura]